MSDPTSMHDDADDLRDPVLQRALENAPDQAATADWRLGQSIRAMAHEAVAPSLPELPVPAERSWWQRLLGIGAGGGVPWNAAFATVLVGVLVTVMWQREPVPGAQLDAPQEERQAAPPAPAPALPPAVREAAPAADKAVERARQAPVRDEAARMKVQPPSPSPPPPPPPSALPAPVTPAAPAAPSRAAGMASPSPAPPAPVAPAPIRAPDPTFNAFAQWTQLRITRNGAASRVLSRADAGDLGGLVGAAAQAGVGSQPLAGTVDWRIALERDGEVLGVLELAGDQVRWRENGVPPGTGAPGARQRSLTRAHWPGRRRRLSCV